MPLRSWQLFRALHDEQQAQHPSLSQMRENPAT
jgi:hypothetical protein